MYVVLSPASFLISKWQHLIYQQRQLPLSKALNPYVAGT